MVSPDPPSRENRRVGAFQMHSWLSSAGTRKTCDTQPRSLQAVITVADKGETAPLGG